MATTLEERMTAVEAELARLKQLLTVRKLQSETPWWEQRFGAFEDDPMCQLPRRKRSGLAPNAWVGAFKRSP